MQIKNASTKNAAYFCRLQKVLHTFAGNEVFLGTNDFARGNACTATPTIIILTTPTTCYMPQAAWLPQCRAACKTKQSLKLQQQVAQLK